MAKVVTLHIHCLRFLEVFPLPPICPSSRQL